MLNSLPDLDGQEMADRFSRFFFDKIDKIRQGFTADTGTESSSGLSSDIAFSEFVSLNRDQIRKLVAGAKPTTSALDPAPTKFVLEFLETLLPVYERIINSSLLSGIVPKAFKTAAVIPLLKKSGADTDVLGNYRPVSNLPYASKLLERAVSDQLQTHLQNNNLNVKFQSAYRRAHSTETALVRTVNDLLSVVDSGDNALLVLLDLSAAFDTIDHPLLLRRLSAEIGIDSTALEWFSSYITDRTQRIHVAGCISAETPLPCGVPQGSVLGPLLFSIYTRQLADVVGSFSVGYQFFADDSELYARIPIDHDMASHALNNVQECCVEIGRWMNRNKLKLNDQKTEALLCGSSHGRKSCPTESLLVGDAEIQFSSSVKTLGVVLDSDLSFEQHISSVVKSCFFHIRSLRKIRPYITLRGANAIAVSLIQSRLDYCNSLFAGLPQTQIKRLQTVQNAAARVVVGARKTDHITPILRQLHWLPVSDRIDHKVLSLAFRAVNEHQPAYLSDLLKVYEPSRSLRSANKSLLVVPGPRDVRTKRYGQRKFSYTAPTKWNTLPLSIRESDSVVAFRRSLKTFLFPCSD